MPAVLLKSKPANFSLLLGSSGHKAGPLLGNLLRVEGFLLNPLLLSAMYQLCIRLDLALVVDSCCLLCFPKW